MADLVMSCCMDDEERMQRYRSRTIDKELEKEKLHFKRTVKILLLGAGESGKSTFLKQMRIIHGKDFDEEALHEYKLTIYNNLVKGMKVLIDAREKLLIPWGNKANVQHAKLVFSYNNNVPMDELVFLEYVPAMKELWKDKGIVTAFDRRRDFQLVSLSFKIDTILVTVTSSI